MAKSSFKKPSLEFYRKKSKQLLKLHRDCDPQALNRIKYNHKRFARLSPDEIAERKFSPADAQTVIARVDGYSDWAQLIKHVESMQSGSDNRSLLFEQAAEAIVNGQLETLRSLLDDHPSLIRARSRRAHRSTLLHYLGANGIEQHRQKTPANAIEIARLLLERGAEPDALAKTYGGGNAQTTLSLAVSSHWPHAAGLQGELVRVLCEYGANPNGLDEDGLPLVTSLVFFYEETATALAQCGAKTDHLLAAASVGSPSDVDACFTSSGKPNKKNRVYLEFDLRPQRNRLELLGQSFAYAAMCGNLATMKRLAGKHKCPINAPADRGIRALHLAAYKGHSDIVDWLLKKKADPLIRDQQWNATPVTWAFQSKQLAIRERILDSMKLGIHLAVDYSRLDTCKKLLKKTPELANSRNDAGMMPIHCLHGGTEDGAKIIELLANAGAELNATDPNGRTAIDRLNVRGRKDLAKLIRKLGGRAAKQLK